MRKSLALIAVLLVVFARYAWSGGLILVTGPAMSGNILPAFNNVSANWANAGLVLFGGIPTRTQCGPTLTPNGTDDFTQIQNAITACPVGQAVQLGAGTFQITMTETITINKGITLRGTGICNNGSSPYCPTVIVVSNGQLATYRNGGNDCGVDTSHIVACSTNQVIDIRPSGQFDQFWSNCSFNTDATGCSTALDADAVQGDTTIRIHDTTHYPVGTWVRIDETSGAVTQPDPATSGTVFGATDFTATSGFPVTGKVVYAGPGVEGGSLYGALYDRATSEIHLVTAVGAGPCPGVNCTITFDSPLTINFRQSHFAQVYYPTNGSGVPLPLVTGVGIENISFTRAVEGTIFMNFCAYCWISGNEIGNWGKGSALQNSVRVEVINNFIHDCLDCENNGAEYPISFEAAVTESLIANNIIVRGGKGMVGRACGGGNVIAYNYEDDTFYQAQSIGNYWIDMGVNGSHYTGCHHALFEGNWGDNCDNDDTHGSVVYHTYFRNQCAGLRTAFNDPSLATSTSVTFNDSEKLEDDANGISFVNGSPWPYTHPGPQRAAGMMAWDYWMAYVGNVLGMSGITTAANGWTYQAFTESNKIIWMTGWQSSGSDKNLNGTTGNFYFRHGNYDYLNNKIVDFQEGFSRNFPNSLYLTSIPAFFTAGASCTYPWPWVTPTGSTPILTNSCGGSGLPAKARFEAGTPFVQP